MVKGWLELKRIEKKIIRQVTFAKRRNGLLKKAYGLSVLCDAKLALIIFSNRDKLSEFSSNLKNGHLEDGSYHEYFKLKEPYEALPKLGRQVLQMSKVWT